MPATWKRHDAGFFTLDLPYDWVMEEPNTGTLLIHDTRGDMALTLVAVSNPISLDPRSKAPARPIAPKEAQFELQKWIDSQKHVRVRSAPRLLAGTHHATATTEGLQQLRFGVPWYKRLLHRAPLMLWRFWAILNPHILLLVSCNGRPEVVERHRPIVDRILLSIHLPDRDILVGRHFTETVVSLARSYFPEMPVAVIDDAHLQFGSQNISVTNLHRRYLAAPEDLPTHVRSFFAAVQNDLPASDTTSWNAARSHIMPVLLTQDAIDQSEPPILCDPWINDLSIGYVLEEEGADRAITPADADHWNVSLEDIHEQALQNLVLRSHEQTMEGHKADGYTMLVLATPDKHNAARVLLPELHRKLREHLGTTFYAALPTREFLLAFSTERDDVLARVRLQIAADYSRSTDGLSTKLFLVTPDGIAGDPQEAEELEF